MSVIHNSSALLGRSSALNDGTARCSTVRSIAYSRHASANTASPVHSRRPASGASGTATLAFWSLGSISFLLTPLGLMGFLEPVPADVVGGIHGLVGAGVGPPATREGAVLAPEAGEGRVQPRVPHRDGHPVAPDIPPVRQRCRREAGEHRRWE